MNRRGFLKAAAVAPIAAPAVAGDVAAKIGLSSAAQLGGMGAAMRPQVLPGYWGEKANEALSDTPESVAEWVRRRLSSEFSDDTIAYRWREAHSMARMLDPDLAACRSISPVAAYRIQAARNFERATKAARLDIEDTAKRWLDRLNDKSGTLASIVGRTLVGMEAQAQTNKVPF
jgi:hypothetical protein